MTTWKEPGLASFITYTPPTILLACVIAVSRWKGISDVMLRSDPSTTTGTPFYLGFVSNIGILIWCACAAICLHSWLLLRKSAAAVHPDSGNFLLGAGLVTAWLLLDDMFLLHETVLPHFGIPEEIVVVGYAAIVAFFLFVNLRRIRRTDYLLLISALFLLGLSAVVDEVPFFYVYLPPLAQGWLEDGTKLLGICGWFSYWLITSTHHFSTEARHVVPLSTAVLKRSTD